MNDTLRKLAGGVRFWSWAIGMLLALSSTGCVFSGPMGSSTQPNVYVLRGTAGYFPNLADFENRLVDEGVCPTVAYPEAHGKIAERIIGGRNRGRLTGPVVIVGYSAGANAAISLAERLGERGIDVDKLVLVETNSSRRIPQNVVACFNVYKSQPWGEVVPVFTGIPVRPASPSTEVVNYDLREFNDGRFDWDNHLTLAANPHVQDLMIDEVLATIQASETSDSDFGTEPPGESVPPEDGNGGAGRASVTQGISPGTN